MSETENVQQNHKKNPFRDMQMAVENQILKKKLGVMASKYDVEQTAENAKNDPSMSRQNKKTVKQNADKYLKTYEDLYNDLTVNFGELNEKDRRICAEMEAKHAGYESFEEQTKEMAKCRLNMETVFDKFGKDGIARFVGHLADTKESMSRANNLFKPLFGKENFQHDQAAIDEIAKNTRDRVLHADPMPLAADCYDMTLNSLNDAHRERIEKTVAEKIAEKTKILPGFDKIRSFAEKFSSKNKPEPAKSETQDAGKEPDPYEKMVAAEEARKQKAFEKERGSLVKLFEAQEIARRTAIGLEENGADAQSKRSEPTSLQKTLSEIENPQLKEIAVNNYVKQHCDEFRNMAQVAAIRKNGRDYYESAEITNDTYGEYEKMSKRCEENSDKLLKDIDVNALSTSDFEYLSNHVANKDNREKCSDKTRSMDDVIKDAATISIMTEKLGKERTDEIISYTKDNVDTFMRTVSQVPKYADAVPSTEELQSVMESMHEKMATKPRFDVTEFVNEKNQSNITAGLCALANESIENIKAEEVSARNASKMKQMSAVVDGYNSASIPPSEKTIDGLNC